MQGIAGGFELLPRRWQIVPRDDQRLDQGILLNCRLCLCQGVLPVSSIDFIGLDQTADGRA